VKIHQLQHITDITEILFAHGIRDVVISPGSRNAPLIKAFYKSFGDGCKSLVDERSAAYFALGKSLDTRKPTVLICTSGTAVLNCAPAIAEAFYQQVPLLVITADRPQEWIGQLDNQAIQQINIFGNNIKASYSLPVVTSTEDELWFVHRIINEAFHKTVSVSPGPVHINVPLREPLYEKLPVASKNLQVIRMEIPEYILPENSAFQADWEKANSILIVCGQLLPDEKLKETIQKLSTDSRVVVMAEPVSNVHQAATIASPEVILNSKIIYPEKAIPELVIYIGGQVVSKKVKLFLRGLQNTVFYRISTDEQIIDTFQNVNAIVNAEPHSILKQLKVKIEGEKSAFKNFWENETAITKSVTARHIDKIGYSDLMVFKEISELLPDGAIVFAGNSSVVRYLLYFNQKQRKFYANRGVSGIDGCLSTAAGLASKTDETVYAIVGDLSFGYDSNALWNRQLPKNLKIILINNEGGGIFHLLKGPSESEDFLPFVNAHHPIGFKKLTEAFGLKYNLCFSGNELSGSVKNLVLQKNGAEVLEIKTPNNGEPQITKDFFKFLNNNYDKELGND
jgi:2-succinyl-5-enolpyruvyl-6-hydroxy-3-cyclohexene-1-carboxylate synthase